MIVSTMKRWGRESAEHEKVTVMINEMIEIVTIPMTWNDDDWRGLKYNNDKDSEDVIVADKVA